MIVRQIDLIDRILALYQKDLSTHFDSYKNHVYRVYHYSIPYIDSDKDIEILSIACAFHDLGIWTDKTFDYIEPSVGLVKTYSTGKNMDASEIDDIVTMIREHHKLTSIKSSRLAEIFRQSDLVDLSLGLIRKGRDRKQIRRVSKEFPNKGFHFLLFKLFLKNLFQHPSNPLPMYKL